MGNSRLEEQNDHQLFQASTDALKDAEIASLQSEVEILKSVISEIQKCLSVQLSDSLSVYTSELFSDWQL